MSQLVNTRHCQSGNDLIVNHTREGPFETMTYITDDLSMDPASTSHQIHETLSLEQGSSHMVYPEPGDELSFEDMFNAAVQTNAAPAAPDNTGLDHSQNSADMLEPVSGLGLAWDHYSGHPVEYGYLPRRAPQDDADDELSPALKPVDSGDRENFSPFPDTWPDTADLAQVLRPSQHSSHGSWSTDLHAGPAYYSSLDSAVDSVPSCASSEVDWDCPGGYLPPRPRFVPPTNLPLDESQSNVVPGGYAFLAASLAKFATNNIDKTPKPRFDNDAWHGYGPGGSVFQAKAGLTPVLKSPAADQANQATTAVLQGPASAYLYTGASGPSTHPGTISGRLQQAKTVADCLRALVESVVGLRAIGVLATDSQHVTGPAHIICAMNNTDDRFLLELYQAVLTETDVSL
jgi:hypothetical protein